MRDPHNIPIINLLHPKVRADFQGFIEAAEAGLNLTFLIVQGMRTFAQQQTIYNQGRTTPGPIVTWSPPGSSYHNYGLAIDICPFHAGLDTLNWDYDFTAVIPYATAAGLTAGLNFPKGMTDPDHFENKLGYNWRQLLHMYNAHDFIPGTAFVNI
jgi:peptidoglycan LD-endopeptidase CwlK